MSFAEFYLTDGETRIDLFGATRGAAGFAVTETVMARATRIPGPRLGVSYETVDEVHRVTLTALSQNQAATYQQDLDRLLEQARRYFDPTIGNESALVWVVSRASEETNPRYAVIYGGQLNDYGDIFGTGFFTLSGRATLPELELALTRSPWLANPPRNPTCIPCANRYPWQFRGEAWQNIFIASDASTVLQMTDLTDGPCVPDTFFWEVTVNDGVDWTSFSTAQNPAFTLTGTDNYGFRLTATCSDSGLSDVVIKYLNYIPSTSLLPSCSGTQTCYRDILTGQTSVGWDALIPDNTVRAAINSGGYAFNNLAGSGINATLIGTDNSSAAGGYGITTSSNRLQFGVGPGENYGLQVNLSGALGVAFYIDNLSNAEVLEIQSDVNVFWFKPIISGAGVSVTGSGTTHLILDANGDGDGLTGWVYVEGATSLTFYYTSTAGTVNVKLTWLLLTNAFDYYANCTSPAETVNIHTLAAAGSIDPLWELINCANVPETP